MALDVFYPKDVRRILEALASSGDLRGPEYQRALADVALAFGVDFVRRRTNLNWSVVPVLALQEGR